MSDYVAKLTGEILDRVVQDHDDINGETFMALFQAMAVTAIASTDGSPAALRGFFDGIDEELTDAAIEVSQNMQKLIRGNDNKKPKLRLV